MKLGRYFVVVVILLLGAYLRWINIGWESLSTDEAAISLKALGVARYGQHTLLGTPMSVGLWHSPLSIYLYALPFRLSADPRLARIFTGALNVFAIALVYVVGARYFGRKAGIIAALLYAVHPEALVATRKIWNPNLGAPFVMGFILSGLMGYINGNRWARLLHLPILSLAIQAHPSTGMLIPLALLLWGYAWINKIANRRILITQTIASGFLAAASLVPWLFGLYADTLLAGNPAGISPLPNRGLNYLLDTMLILLGNWEQNFVQPVQPALTILGAFWLLLRTVRRREAFPGLIVVLGFLLVPVTTLVLDIQYRGYHIWPSFPNAFLIQGALLGGVFNEGLLKGPLARLWNWKGLLPDSILRWAAIPVVAIIVITQLRFFTTYDRSNTEVPLETQINAIRAALDRAAAQGRELLLLIPGIGSDEYAFLRWEVLNADVGASIIRDGRALPLPTKGAVLLGPADYVGRPELFSGGELFYDFFKIAELAPADSFQPDIRMRKEVHLANGATVIGFRRTLPESSPIAGETWPLAMIWRVDSISQSNDKVFVHLIDQQDNNFGQSDVAGLPVAQWEPGELVLSQLKIQLAEDLPASGPLFLRFGMYNDLGQIDVLDASGSSLGGFSLVQIRGMDAPAAKWENGLVLDSLFTPSDLTQGPPLSVTAPWNAMTTMPEDIQLSWRLTAPDSTVVFESRSKLFPDTDSSHLPSGAFEQAVYDLRIPVDIEPGPYALTLLPIDRLGEPIGDTFHSPKSVEISARKRSFDPPPMSQALNVTFGEEIELSGYDLNVNASELNLALHWLAQGSIPIDYKFFVHVWNNDKIVTQYDSMPAAYAYPTSWWASGEYFSDEVTLALEALPAGEYSVTVGLYDPITNTRLPITFADGTLAADEWALLERFNFTPNGSRNSHNPN